MSEPDVVVVGAGPGGGCVAWMLAARGARVVLVDRAGFPRQKVCGGCLASPGVRALERFGVASSIPSLNEAPELHAVDLRSGALKTRVAIPGYRVIDRAVFDDEIMRAVTEQGAECLHGTRASVRRDGSVSLDNGSGVRRVRPRVVVVADGLSGSSLDDDDRFAWRTKVNARVGVGATSSGFPDGLAHDAVTMMHAQSGYLGVARMHGGRAVVAAAVDPGWLRAHAEGGALTSIIRSHGFDEAAFGSFTRTGGAPALTRTRSRVEADGRVFLIGDATGYIEPFTGEGMSWSIDHAERVVPVVLDALGGRRVEGDWTRALSGARLGRTALCRVVTRAVRSPTVTRSVIRVCARSSGASRLVSRAVHRLQGAA